MREAEAGGPSHILPSWEVEKFPSFYGNRRSAGCPPGTITSYCFLLQWPNATGCTLEQETGTLNCERHIGSQKHVKICRSLLDDRCQWALWLICKVGIFYLHAVNPMVTSQLWASVSPPVLPFPPSPSRICLQGKLAFHLVLPSHLWACRLIIWLKSQDVTDGRVYLYFILKWKCIKPPLKNMPKRVSEELL